MRSRVASDSGLSSDSRESFDGEFCRAVIPVLDRLSTGEKLKFLEQQITDIRVAKSSFRKMVHVMDEAIEGMTRRIGTCAQARERYLKVLLQRICQAKMLEWERQLKVCQDAEETLNQFRQGTLINFESTIDAYARSIGFIDGGHVEFVRHVTPLLQQLDVFGEFLFDGGSVKTDSEKANPKLLIGRLGKNIGEFCRPWGVCSDPTGRILVADRGNNRVQVFSECGEFQFRFGESGSGPGQFDRPAGITVDRKLRIIVSDKDNHRVQVFTFSGSFLFSFGSKGTDPGLFHYPWDVDSDEQGNIVVSDTRNRRIQLFDEGGAFIGKCDFNERIRGLSRRISPRGVVFRSDGTLMVTDFNNHCILVISRDLKGVTKWKGGNENLLRPQGIARDGRGTVAVVDSKNNRVQVYDECGNLVRLIGRKGSNPGEFDSLQDVCFHTNGNIIVTEFGNNRVQML